MLDNKKEEVSFKKYEFAFSLTLFVIFIILLILISEHKIAFAETCGDGSHYGSCSEINPYHCDNGFLVEKASICGCGQNSAINGDSCISQYQTETKEITLNYLIDGREKNLDFAVYKGLTNYLSNQSKVISYQAGQNPVRADFKFNVLNNEQQRALLLPLVVEIQNMANNKIDQARIAINLVQNIEYGFSNKTETFFGQAINYSRYPYEVLYDAQGICGEKSDLLAFLLRELGYGTVIFYNQKENHESIGIKCPVEESHKKTGYCFVETSGSAIISDDSIEYINGIVLKSEPEVIFISNGKSLPRGLPEYRDAEIMKTIRAGKPILFRNFELGRLEKKYGLVEEYNIA